MEMRFDDPNTLKIVRKPTNKRATMEKRRDSQIKTGKTSLSPVRRSSINLSPKRSSYSSPRRGGGGGGDYDRDDYNGYVSSDFTEQGFESTSPSKKRTSSPSKKYDGPFDPTLSTENPEYQAKRQQILN